jgi:integrase
MIYKRGGHWHLDVTMHGVRYREALDTTDKRVAKDLEKKRIAEINQGKRASKTGLAFARIPFSDAAERFLEDRRGHVAERTIQFERERLKPLASFFGDKPLIRIKAEDITNYQRARLESGLSGKTINMDVGVLRLMMKKAKCWNMVVDDVKMFPKRSRVVGKVLTPEQKARLFRVAGSKPDWLVAHCAAVLAVSTSCRSVELKNARWRDFDVFIRTMDVKRSKTEAGHRAIPLNGDAMAALARLKERAQIEGADEPDDFVFPACENGHIDRTRPQKSWRSAWRSLTRAAGLTGYRFHDLRHQAITEMAEAGAPDATIKAVAGHIDQTMMEHYSHVRMAAKRDVLEKLASGLMGTPAAESEQADKAN